MWMSETNFSKQSPTQSCRMVRVTNDNSAKEIAEKYRKSRNQDVNKNAFINHILSDKHFDLRKQIHPGTKIVSVGYFAPLS